MSLQAIADTHSLLWYLYDDPRLSRPAASVMDAAEAAGEQIGVSSIALAEVVYLIEKGRIDSAALDRILGALNQPDATLVEIPVDRAIVLAMRRIDRAQVPDLPDRIVAATSLHLGVPAISRDQKIRSSIITTIW